MMVSIYGQTDKLMLKQMLSEEATGYYATAGAICSMWTFILTAIILFSSTVRATPFYENNATVVTFL